VRTKLAVLTAILPLLVLIVAKHYFFNVYPVPLIIEFIPAYYAPLCAPVSRLMKKPHPIDRGIMFRDKRLLGDGKTIEGTLVGIFAAVIVGYILLNDWLLGLTFGIGAMLGDILNSFIKRQIGLKRGEHFLFFDELNFLFFPVLYAYFFLTITIVDIIVLVMFALALHFIFDRIALSLNVKNKKEI